MHAYSARSIENRALAGSVTRSTSQTDVAGMRRAKPEQMVFRGGKFVSADEVGKLPAVRTVTKPSAPAKPAPKVSPLPTVIAPEPAPVVVTKVKTAPVVEVKAEPVPVVDELTCAKDAFRAEIAATSDATFAFMVVPMNTREKVMTLVDRARDFNGLDFLTRKFREGVEHARVVNGFRDELLVVVSQLERELIAWFESGTRTWSSLIAEIKVASKSRLDEITVGLQSALQAMQVDEARRLEAERADRIAAEAEQARIREQAHRVAQDKAAKEAQRRQDDARRKERANAQRKVAEDARKSRNLRGLVKGSTAIVPATKVVDARPVGERLAALTDEAIAEVYANEHELKWRFPNRAKLVNAAKNPAGLPHVIAFIDACERAMQDKAAAK